jgi:hypothetical protein
MRGMLPIPPPSSAGALLYAPADAPLASAREVNWRLPTDQRVSWTAHFALDSRSSGERKARARFTAHLLRGLHALEAVWYACLVDRGPPEDVSLKHWCRYWCTGLLGTIASVWLRDPLVQALIGNGRREGVSLAQGYLPRVVTELFLMGTDPQASRGQRTIALEKVAKIALSLDDHKPDQASSIQERQARAREILAKHTAERQRLPQTAALPPGVAQDEGGADALGTDAHEDIAPYTTRQEGERGTEPPRRLPGPRGGGDGRSTADRGEVSSPAPLPPSESYPPAAKNRPNPISHNSRPGPMPSRVVDAISPRAGRPTPEVRAPRKTPLAPAEDEAVHPYTRTQAVPSESMVLPAGVKEPSGDADLDAMRRRIARVKAQAGLQGGASE